MSPSGLTGARTPSTFAESAPYPCPMVRRDAADDDVPGRRSNGPETPEASTTGLHVIAALAFRGGGLHRSRGRAAGCNESSDWHYRPAGRPNGSAAAIPGGRPLKPA